MMQGKSRLLLRVNRDEATQKIQARIEMGYALSERNLRSMDEMEAAITDFLNWAEFNRTLLLKIFDSPSVSGVYNNRCSVALVKPAIRSRLDFNTRTVDTVFYENLRIHRERIDNHINHLKGLCDQLELYDNPSDSSQSTFSNEVFIVHGHDDKTKVTVARFVENLGIEATILHERENRGQTIPEKFEEHASKAGFAIILLTPDDVGASKDEKDKIKDRARQNVVLELGYFWGRLGRERVCVLHKERVELPSDIQGILYIPMDSSDGWKLKLGREMKQAGLPADMNNLV